ncbi:MAG: putative tricarboxylic transport membrane protein [Lysobacterales bacterium]|jgi:putative tricarboxylic transport membrane protein
MSDRIFALAWLSVCALIVYQMWILSVPFAYEPVGPKAFPMILSVLMAICCVALLFKPDRDIHWPERPLLLKGVVLLAILLAYANFYELIGFPVCTVIMALLVSRIFGGSWKQGVSVSVALGVLGYLFFDRLLEVSLPLGRVWS